MSENSPAPTPARGVYGFTLYLGCSSAFCLYIAWAVVPDEYLHLLGITYYPQKYWAIALPVYAMMCLALFTFFLYPALNQLLTPPLNCISTLEDSHSHLENTAVFESNNKIPPAADLDIRHVCAKLYLNK